MSTNTHGTPQRSTWLWVTLLAATFLTWGVGEQGLTGTWVVAALALISFWKGAVVILDFMALRNAPLLWRAITMGWIILVWSVIAIAYMKGLAQ
ncbi:cytochrome C oxidase subunit IV family protein [Thauera chlorobenzoica]|uniref:Nitric oxide reductase activation protein NorF n=1 Tax=Thauera chlorobenzoica TaxID=96773 RepID=A0A1H5V075_9RHOO|nr:cytochrome C oxidase subunit IV family protein [Thauera chlorobenzoica]APR05434.1 Nitric oxide reductase activation protein NorF [Thauera chlorobenzoica]SEF80755.1 Cytochrome C oxidase subunit IV [Thauera chlorobenzoica]